MGDGKMSPIVIIVFLILIAAVGFVGLQFIKGNATGPVANAISSKNDTPKSSRKDVPVITTTLSSDEPEQDEVVVTVKAKVKDEEGIKTVTMPDGEVIEIVDPDQELTYTVTENGEYEFKAVANNGEKTSTKITIDNIRLISADHPYIPEGFSEVVGSPESGFVISDAYGNEYVWIPCPTGKTIRKTALEVTYEESSDSASSLVNSVGKYFGFYLGRYEASAYQSDGQLVAASMKGAVPWTDISYLDAATASVNSAGVFGYTDDYETNIISSYAWDTALDWIDKTHPESSYSSSTKYGNYEGTIKETGTTQKDQVNYICDMAGNVREWTTELYDSTKENTKRKNNNKRNQPGVTLSRVVRGGSANLGKTAISHTAYEENTSDTYWGFRMVLYKK